MLRLFQHYIPSSIIWLIVVELIVLYFSVYLAVELRFSDPFGDPSDKILLGPLMPKAFSFALVLWLSMTGMGLHTRNVVDDFSGMMIRIFLSFGLGFVANTLLFYIAPDLFLGRGVFLFAILIAFFGILFTRTLFQNIDNNELFRRRIIVLGAGKKAKIIEKLEKEAQKRGQEILGYICVDSTVAHVDANKIIKVKTSLLDLAKELDVDEIVVAMTDRRQGFPAAQLMGCKMQGIFVRDLLNFVERIKGNIELDVLHPSIMIFSPGFVKASKNKRIFDILVSLFILVLTSPIFISAAILIWLSSFGTKPVFYKQTRVGLAGNDFSVLKFRSMEINAEKNGAQFAKKNDSRVTLIGRVIRKTRIDELPQLLNVLKGDMSFVGPRPERPEFVKEFIEKIPHYDLRHIVKPGISGWAQICYPYGENIDDTRNKLEYDLYYIKNYSLFLDLTIIFQTVQVVVFGQGAR